VHEWIKVDRKYVFPLPIIMGSASVAEGEACMKCHQELDKVVCVCITFVGAYLSVKGTGSTLMFNHTC